MAKKKKELLSGYYDATKSKNVTDANIVMSSSGWKIERNNVAPVTTTTKTKSSTSNNQIAPVKTTTKASTKTANKDGYTDTGKTLGEYSKVDYENRKNWKVYSKDNKFYFYNEKSKKYEMITNNTNNEMVSADSINTNKKTSTTKKTIASVANQTPFTTETDHNQLGTGKLDLTGKTTAVKQNEKSDYDKLSLQNKIKVDTANITEEEKKEYASQLRGQEEVERQQKLNKYNSSTNPILNMLDTAKTRIGSTATTTSYILNKGMTKGVEGLMDAGATVGAFVTDKIGQKETSQNLKNWVKENRAESVTKLSPRDEVKMNYAENNSIIKRDNLGGMVVENVGQMIPTLVLGGVGGKTAAYAVTGLTGLGMGSEEALNEGANIDQATLYGIASGAKEIATEWITGGIPGVKGTAGGGLDKLVAKGLGQETLEQVSSSIGKSLIKSGYKMAGEGLEEGISEALTPFLKNAIYSQGETINWENVIQNTIIGAITAGVLNAPSSISDAKASVNNSTTSKATFDNILQTRIKKAKEDNSNLTDEEIKQITTETKEDIKNGNLSIDEIEETFGGETYQAYKKILEQQQELKNQIEELDNTPFKTNKEQREIQAKISELEKKLEEANAEPYRYQLNKEMLEKTKNNSILQKSYKEYGKSATPFTYEVNENASDLVKNVYKSAEIMNDTQKAHNLVDMVAKISNDTGIQYQFTNTEGLKDNGYNLSGKVVINGVTTADGKVLINIDSVSALNRVVGHETTHLFENTEEYKILQNEVFEYAKMKGEYETRRNEIITTYKGVNANIDNELTSDLIGDYLFSDEDFVKQLSKNKNIFQKIYDKIKQLYKMATAGSKEKRQLEKIKHTFEKMYRDNKAEVISGVKYSIQTAKDGSRYVKIDTDQDIFKGKKVYEQTKIAKKYILETFRDKGLIKDGEKVDVTSKTANEYTHPKNQLPQATKSSKMKASTELDNLLEISTYKYSKTDDGRHPFARNGWDYYETKFMVDKKMFEGLINIGKSGNKKTLYDITNIKRISQNRSTSAIAFTTSLANSSINNVPQSNNNVKSGTTKYSISKKEKNTNELENSSFSLKEKQLDIILKNNPAFNETSTWIRKVEDIKTFEETLKDEDYKEYYDAGEDFDETYTADMAKNALDSGKITVYSSYPIEQGIFVSPSRMEAESYSGNGKVYSKEVRLDDIAWIDPTQGQYAKVNNKYSLSDYNIKQEQLKKLTDFDITKEDVKIKKAIAPLKKEIKNISKELENTKKQLETTNKINFPAPLTIEQEIEIAESLNGERKISPTSPIEERSMEEVGDRSIKAYQYENPEVKPYFQEEAQNMLYDLNASIKGERMAIGEGDTFTGTTRETTDDIAYLLDNYHYTYQQIEDGLNDIIQDHGSENNAVSKRLEILIDERLRNGYNSFGLDIPANQEYLDFLMAKNITEYSPEALKALEEIIDNATMEKNTQNAIIENDNEAKKVTIPKEAKTPKDNGEVAEILEAIPDKTKEKSGVKEKLVTKVVDKGYYIDKLARKYNNPELSAKYDYSLMANGVANQIIGIGRQNLETGEKIGKSLYEIFEPVENANLVKEFSEYLYHKHNIDRMNLAHKYGEDNKPVFGASVTAEDSKKIIHYYEIEYPEFLSWAKDVYDYNNANLDMLVEYGVISSEDKEYYNKKYPHYVPIVRDNSKNKVQYDILPGKKASVHSPIKKAKGGNQNLIPLKDAMAIRTMQTSNSALRNNFGKELYKTLYGDINEINSKTEFDENIIDGFDEDTNVITPSDRENHATFTVFNNGKKVTMEIDDEIYEALKSSNIQTIDFMNKLNNFKRGVLTEFNPLFWLTNPAKDIQDGFINSKHPTGFIKNLPLAIKEIVTKGNNYQLYIANGGSYETYFNYNNGTNVGKNNKILPTKDNISLKSVLGIIPKSVSAINNAIELTPRMAEFISSRKAGDGIEKSVYNAQEVTTNFKRGGDWTKTLDRNGATFLNASMQGMTKQIRNIQEGRQVRVAINLAVKFAIIGGMSQILNNMIWDDDDDYEKLSNYVKNNYYIVGKYGDGKFIRIPKGRVASAIQMVLDDAISTIKGEKVNLQELLEQLENQVMVSNVVESNVFTPLADAINNKTWYGENLIPSRLENVPDSEQYDETTDSISIWLGEKLNLSPYKINYFLNQSSGVIGDLILPMLTKQAESDADTVLGQIVAPLRDKFTADSVNNTQLVTDIYNLRDELAKKKNSTKATEQDVLKYKYIYSTVFGLSDYYKKKREIQSSDKSNREKIKETRKIQKQINEMVDNALSTYEDVEIEGNTARVGKQYYKKNKNGEWVKQ